MLSAGGAHKERNGAEESEDPQACIQEQCQHKLLVLNSGSVSLFQIGNPKFFHAR